MIRRRYNNGLEVYILRTRSIIPKIWITQPLPYTYV